MAHIPFVQLHSTNFAAICPVHILLCIYQWTTLAFHSKCIVYRANAFGSPCHQVLHPWIQPNADQKKYSKKKKKSRKFKKTNLKPATWQQHCIYKYLHNNTLVRKIPWMEEPGGPQSIGSRRVGHDWATSLSLFTLMHWKRKWQPTPVFLPGESQGRGSLVGCHLWGCIELDTTEVT